MWQEECVINGAKYLLSLYDKKPKSINLYLAFKVSAFDLTGNDLGIQ